MSRLILVDGNSIMNRAFYGIMGSKMLTTSDGIYTNAVYGFLSILFKIEEDLNPDYIAVAFDLKGPTTGSISTESAQPAWENIPMPTQKMGLWQRIKGLFGKS